MEGEGIVVGGFLIDEVNAGGIGGVGVDDNFGGSIR